MLFLLIIFSMWYHTFRWIRYHYSLQSNHVSITRYVQSDESNFIFMTQIEYIFCVVAIRIRHSFPHNTHINTHIHISAELFQDDFLQFNAVRLLRSAQLPNVIRFLFRICYPSYYSNGSLSSTQCVMAKYSSCILVIQDILKV